MAILVTIAIVAGLVSIGVYLTVKVGRNTITSEGIVQFALNMADTAAEYFF